MSIKADQFLSQTLGEDFFESLAKVELWKPGTRTTIDHEEIKTALQIVPRTVMAILIRELSAMSIGDHKDIPLPFGKNAKLLVDKHERDVYSGQLEEENKVVVDFKYRSLPGIGLVILSAFELYDMDKKPEHKAEMAEGAEDKVQKLIEDRIAMRSLVEEVVEHKLAHKDAVAKLLLMKLTESLDKKPEPAAEPALPEVSLMMSESTSKPKKVSPLKEFLEKRKKKKPQEFSVEMAKGENVHCPDCQKNIFDGQLFSGCICLGDDREKKVFIKKTEGGIKVRFSKGWDEENIEMLLEVMRKKHA